MALKAKGEKHGPGQALSSNSVVWKKERLGGIFNDTGTYQEKQKFQNNLIKGPTNTGKTFVLKTSKWEAF